jgi:CO/xanthine dehydrogenase Mo-binding subunit
MTGSSERAVGLAGADVDLGLRPKNIGARVKRVEDRRLLTGEGAFTGDRTVPGALHIAFRRSDHPHALISRINTAVAAELPGVFAIYTAQDLDDLVEPVRASSRMTNYHATALYPLARGKVRYVGEPVVAVLAENRYLAEDARDRIEIAYEPLETVIDPEMAVRADAPLLHEEAGTNVLAAREFARGDIGAEMAAAPVRVGGRFRFHRKTPVAIENRGTLARQRGPYPRALRWLLAERTEPGAWRFWCGRRTPRRAATASPWRGSGVARPPCGGWSSRTVPRGDRVDPLESRMSNP